MRSMLPESTPLLVAACVILAVATVLLVPTYLYFADACFCLHCRPPLCPSLCVHRRMSDRLHLNGRMEAKRHGSTRGSLP